MANVVEIEEVKEICKYKDVRLLLITTYNQQYTIERLYERDDVIYVEFDQYGVWY